MATHILIWAGTNLTAATEVYWAMRAKGLRPRITCNCHGTHAVSLPSIDRAHVSEWRINAKHIVTNTTQHNTNKGEHNEV